MEIADTDMEDSGAKIGAVVRRNSGDSGERCQVGAGKFDDHAKGIRSLQVVEKRGAKDNTGR
ncbi:MAG: hypothetical protein WKH97_01740 [Casimicrobiaceae bacterium]